MINLVFYTNCQCRGIDFFLKKRLTEVTEVNTKHIENFTLIKDKLEIPIDVLKNTDLFIYQPIDRKHGPYSTDPDISGGIMSYLPSDCKKISFPYIYNSALWVFIPPAAIDGLIGEYVEVDKYENPQPIQRLKKLGHSLDEVLSMYSRGEIDFDYHNRFNKSIGILKEKEKHCDVKISDFIERNIRKQKLFFTQNHPTTCVFIHCVNQILSILGDDYMFDETLYPNNICNLAGRHPHTSYDLRHWGFEYKEEYVNDGNYIVHIKNIYNNYNC